MSGDSNGPPYSNSDTVQQVLTANTSLLDNIYNFPQTPSCNDQAQVKCVQLANFMRQLLGCALEQGQIATLLTQLSDADSDSVQPRSPNAHHAVQMVFQTMADETAVQWAPEFGAALVVSSQTVPCTQAIIYALGLDSWELHQHRQADTGKCTASAQCNSADPLVVAVTEPKKVNLKKINSQVHQAVADCSAVRKRHKKAHTAGFFHYLCTKVTQQQISPAAHTERLQLFNMWHDAKAAGGFRDVGMHTTSEKLPTCWPLVEQVFHFVADQVSTIDSAAAMAAFYAVLAHGTCMKLTSTDQLGAVSAVELDQAMQKLGAAAQAIARLVQQHPMYEAIGSALAKLLRAAREGLDGIITQQQKKCCAAAEIESLSHQNVISQLKPFTANLPPRINLENLPAAAPQNHVANLSPISFPPENGDLSAVVQWAQLQEQAGMKGQQTRLLLCEIEATFFQQMHESFSNSWTVAKAAPLPQAEELLRVYSKALKQFEAQHDQHSCDLFTDVLTVEFRSREAVLVWIMLCMAHRHAAAEFRGLQKYALPVQPDDLRHLVLRDRRALHAAQAVAAYIAAVNCNATAGPVFSTLQDSTSALAAEYAEGSAILVKQLAEEQRVADDRTAAHWRRVQAMKKRVEELEAELAAAMQELVEKEQAKDDAFAALQAETEEAKEVVKVQHSIYSDFEPDGRVQPWLAVQQAVTDAERYVQDLLLDQAEQAGDMETAAGMSYRAAMCAVKAVGICIEGLRKDIAQARLPPVHVYQALPDPRLERHACMALLFFLYPQHTGSFPLLRQYCCAAQQCFAPLPASAAGQETAFRNKISWVEFYNARQQECDYVQRDGHLGQTEQSTQLVLFRTAQPPPQRDFGPPDVMEYITPDAGVWWPMPELAHRRWRGGPIARYSSVKTIDPFAPRDHAAIAAAYTERGVYHEWLKVATVEEASRLCLRAGACGGSCCSRYRLQDTAAEVEAVRGNRVLAEQMDRPQGMSPENWQAFASLRAYPLQQLRVLCIALREGHLLLNCPQVLAAVRTVLYHVGQLERVGPTVRRLWERDEGEVLCKEVLRLADVMQPSPKLLLQGPLLCEIASHLAQLSAGGRLVARSCMAMAAGWATQIKAEITALRASGDARGKSAQHSAAQTKCAIAHCCAVICFGSASFDEGAAEPGTPATMDSTDAAFLVLHRAQAYLHTFSNGPEHLKGRLALVADQCDLVMAQQSHRLNSAIAADPALLSSAVRSVFADLPQGTAWHAIAGHPGCHTAEAQGQVYSINVVTGCVLCNGVAPGHLPAVIVQHAAYKQLFQSLTFEVSQLQQQQQTMFRTRWSHAGYIFAFQLKGEDLHVAECPVDAATGEVQHELELELLPGHCKWAPDLPARLKLMHSHWLSRSENVIVLRGKSSSDRRTQFLLRGAKGIKMFDTQIQLVCYCVPQFQQDQDWRTALAATASFERMWHGPGPQHAAIRMLTRFEDARYIHVATQGSSQSPEPRPAVSSPASLPTAVFFPSPAVVFFHLPRYRLTFELHPGSEFLSCTNFSGYHLPKTGSCTGGPLLPLLRFSTFLVLLPSNDDATMPVKLLVPDGTLSTTSQGGKLSAHCKIDTSAYSAEAGNLGHHAYSFHKRTLGFDTAVVHSRLFLAALYAATHCDVPIPQLGMTGGEHALQLLRQSWVNRPLSHGEASALIALAKLAGHTPPLQLLCRALAEDSRALEFLHPSSRGWTSLPARDVAQCDAFHLYNQNARRTGSLGFVHIRQQLTRDEEQRVRGRARAGVSACKAQSEWMQTVKWDEVRLCSVLEDKLAHAVWQEEFFKELADVHNEYCTPKPAGVPVAPGQLSIAHLQGDAFGQEIADDCEQSLKHSQLGKAELHVEPERLPALAERLKYLLVLVTRAERQLAASLLNGLGFSVPGKYGTAVVAFQAAGLMAQPAQADLLRVTVFQETTSTLNPLLAKDSRDALTLLVHQWQRMCVLQDKLERCLRRCGGAGGSHMDLSLSALAAELGNVRTWDPVQHPAWLAFEVLQGLEIRERQATVAQHMLQHHGGPGLAEDHRGAILQLNMGEGKTRVILPMLVLALCGRGEVVRLNFLQELLPEAVDYLHSCLTGSLLQVKLLLMPFSRDVAATPRLIAAMTAQLRFCASIRAFVCVSREERLSLELKAQEVFGSVGDGPAYQQLLQLASLPTFDVLDECDELLASKFQLVYAWGSQQELPGLAQRIHVLQAVMQILQDDEYVRDILADGAIVSIQHHPQRHGAMPELRLLAGHALDTAWGQLCTAICRAMFNPDHIRSKALMWITMLDASRQNQVLRCCTDSLHDVQSSMNSLNLAAKERCHVLMLRGLLAFDLLFHCLMKRHNVDYGITDRKGKHSTHMAVPFRACGTPTPRSEFKHPDVNLCLTQLAYLQRGLTLFQVKQCMEVILGLEISQQDKVFRSIISRSRSEGMSPTETTVFASIENLAKIDLTNDMQLQVLHGFLQYNTTAIAFWLEHCIYPHETKLFPENLRRTSWHMAHTATGKVVGFSGTNDNRSLLPLQVSAQDTADTSIKGTNGRMLHLLLQPGKCSFARLSSPEDKEPDLARRSLNLAIQRGAHALIDAGAQLAGLQQNEAAKHLLDNMHHSAGGGAQDCQGVVFYAGAGSMAAPGQSAQGWYVMDQQKHCLPKSRLPIHEADAFVIFDEARCRGSDMKLQAEAKAVLTLGPKMGRDKFMQAAARLRQLDKRQSIIVAAPADICASIAEVCHLNPATAIQPQHVLQWVLWNTARANARAFAEYLWQGKQFVYSLDKPVFADEESCCLERMYGRSAAQESMDEFLQKPMWKGNAAVALTANSTAWLTKLRGNGMKHGHQFSADATLAAEECEREIEQEEEQEQEREIRNTVPKLTPAVELTWPNTQDALQLDSARDFAAAQGIQVVELRNAASHLLSGEADQSKAALLPKLNWATNVIVTVNFLSCTDSGTAMAAHVRSADNLLLYPDETILLISEREAEQVLCFMRANPGCHIRARLVNLAMCRWTAASPSHPWHLVPLTIGPKSGQQEVQSPLTYAVASTQMFNGETEYICESAAEGADGNTSRRATVATTVFGQVRGQAHLGECADAAEALVELRGKRRRWADSDLEDICVEEVTRSKFERIAVPA